MILQALQKGACIEGHGNTRRANLFLEGRRQGHPELLPAGAALLAPVVFIRQIHLGIDMPKPHLHNARSAIQIHHIGHMRAC